jgi:hypothetical protein
LSVDLDEFVHTAQGGLLLACHEVRADAKTVDFMMVASQMQENLR